MSTGVDYLLEIGASFDIYTIYAGRGRNEALDSSYAGTQGRAGVSSSE